jgi:hypothetical protein
MKPADLSRALGKGKSPFRPFKLRLTDGREIVCDDPDRWCVAENGGAFVVAEKRHGFTILTADQIAEVTPVPAGSISPNPNGGE